MTMLMPLGDSLTVGVSASVTAGTETGYRSPLYTAMLARGDRVSFVGSQNTGNFQSPLHEGHSGFRIDEIDAQVSTWLPAAKPDVIVLMAGTNDAAQGLTGASTRMGTLLDHIVSYLPSVRIYVSTIPPINPSAGGGTFPSSHLAEVYNSELPAVISAKSAAGMNVHLINAGGALLMSSLDVGGIHLTPTGYGNLATLLLAGLPSFP